MYRTITRLLGVALAVTLLAAVPIGAEASAPAAAGPDPVLRAGPGYHQPAPGSCHLITIEHYHSWSAPSKSVDCDTRHTSVTLVSKRLKGKVNWKQPDLRPIWFSCLRKERRILGGDKVRAMSAYGVSFYIPTKRERARGAKWLRCDLSLQGGRVLQAMPQELALHLPLKDKVLRCARGPVSELLTTVCSKTHSFRTTGAFKARGTKYPGPEALRRQALRRCPKFITTRWWIYRPPLSRELWNAGQRTVVCLSKTKK